MDNVLHHCYHVQESEIGRGGCDESCGGKGRENSIIIIKYIEVGREGRNEKQEIWLMIMFLPSSLFHYNNMFHVLDNKNIQRQ